MFADGDDARKPPSELPSVDVLLSGDDDFWKEAKFGSTSLSSLLFDSAKGTAGFATFCVACLALFLLCTFVVIFVHCPLRGEDQLVSSTAGIFLSSSSSVLLGGS